ncbi:MAG: Bax inhibitor-1/YccA family protein [Micropruina sp.]|nr:Bax inhibitor-1/YccA family protein [Micropruina sp.]
MRSTNPVLSRPDAFTPQQRPYQPFDQYGNPVPGYQGAPPESAGVMTIDDVITKSAVTMGTLIAVAGVTFMLLPVSLLYPALIVSGLVGFVTVLLVSFRRVVNPALVLAYSAIEGVFIGAFSLLFEMMYPGIVTQAVLGTFVAAGVTLAAYKYFRIRVTNKFRKMVLMSTMAFAGVMLVNFVLSLFNINLGLRDIGPEAGMLAIAASALGVVLAVFNLIMDFDYIEQGIAMRAPASESWRGAFGLTVTMVWLYTELLRILSYFRR